MPLEVEALWVDDHDPDDPVGIKGIGEVGIVGAAAAVANAVWHATGCATAACRSARTGCCGREVRMLDLADDLRRWLAEEREFAVATVVSVGGSARAAPAPPSPSTATAR